MTVTVNDVVAIVVNLCGIQVIVYIEMLVISHIVESENTTETAVAFHPKLSPVIVRTSPPRKLMSVFGVTDVTSTGVKIDSVISFDVRPFAVLI